MSVENSYYHSLGPEKNSPLRRWVAGEIQPITETLHKRLPNLTPNHLSIIGAIGVGLGSWLAEKINTSSGGVRSPYILGLIGFSSLLDAFDGALARLIAKEDPQRIDLLKGQVIDSLSDHFKELAMFISRVVVAHKRHDRFGELTAYSSMIVSPLSSRFRAHTESLGEVVPELGGDAIKFFGTRTGRQLLCIPATVYNRIGNLHVQPYLDLLILAGDCANIFHHLGKTVPENVDQKLPVETQEKAKQRVKVHTVLTGINIATAIFLHQYLRRYKK